MFDLRSKYVSHYPSVERIMHSIVEDHGNWFESVEELIDLIQEERPDIKEEKIRLVIKKQFENGRALWHF